MSRTIIRKLFPIACITIFAAAGVSIGHPEMVRIIGHSDVEAVALQTTPPKDPPILQGQMSRPADPIYKRYLGHKRYPNYTPMTRVAVR